MTNFCSEIITKIFKKISNAPVGHTGAHQVVRVELKKHQGPDHKQVSEKTKIPKFG